MIIIKEQFLRYTHFCGSANFLFPSPGNLLLMISFLTGTAAGKRPVGRGADSLVGVPVAESPTTVPHLLVK